MVFLLSREKRRRRRPEKLSAWPSLRGRLGRVGDGGLAIDDGVDSVKVVC